jgi:DNA-binding CsgD family transcriptional regulator/tetratricopeptide (TPR) repeat protein
VPALLRQVITQRIGRLGAEVEGLLTVAAVVGEEWELAVVEAVLGLAEEPLLQALEDALAAKVIVPVDERTERYRFAHVLIREVLYDGHLARRRKHLHARAGAMLEALAGSGRQVADRANALAYHFYAAEHWAKAAQYSLAAGDIARDRFASHSALLLYHQALDAAQHAPDADPHLLLALYERLGHVQMVLNRREQAESEFTRMQQAAQAHGDRLAEGRALYWLSYIRARLYRLAEARATAEAALRAAGQVGNTRLLALTHWSLGHLYLITGEAALVDRYLEQAEQFAREGGEHDVLGRCLQDLALLRTFEGSYARAELLADEALVLARTSRDTIVIAGACFRLGLVSGELGRYARARQALQSGLEHVEVAGDHHNHVRLLNSMGWLHCELGDFETALRWDQQALEVSRREDVDRVSEAERYTLLNLATDELYAGRVDAAERYLAAFDQVLDDNEYGRFRHLNRYQLLRAEVALARRDFDPALRWSQEAAALAAAKGMRKNVTKSWLLGGRALLALGRTREAVDLLRQGVTLADELKHGSLRWQARLWLGQAYSAHGEPATAAELYRQAWDQVTTIAAGLADERLRSCLLASPFVEALRAAAAAVETPEEGGGPHGGAPLLAAPHAERDAYPAGLTAREVAVLRLAAEGATNAAIAAGLHVSVKTVEVHMTSILGKTGCANRAAAAAFALRHGLA